MSDEPKSSRTWVPWAIGIGFVSLGIVMCLIGRPGAMSDRPDFYLSYDGIAYLLSPCVGLVGMLWLAILVLRSGRQR